MRPIFVVLCLGIYGCQSLSTNGSVQTGISNFTISAPPKVQASRSFDIFAYYNDPCGVLDKETLKVHINEENKTILLELVREVIDTICPLVISTGNASVSVNLHSLGKYRLITTAVPNVAEYGIEVVSGFSPLEK